MLIEEAAVASNRILLVDDDIETIKALRRILEAEQYAICSAATGQEAMEKIKSTLPYIVLLDLGLPDTNGVDLLNTMKSVGVKHVIIISGTNSVEITHSCLRAGAFDFLLKPIGREELMLAVRRASSSYEVGQVTHQRYPLELYPGFGALETPSVLSQRLFRQLKLFRTSSFAHSLITGPAGLLKRDIASLVNHYNDRSGPALLISCALETDDNSITRFTGTADSRNASNQAGYIDQAKNGSLVLDDISLLPLPVQRWLVEYIDQTRAHNDSTQPTSHNGHCNIIGILKEPIELTLNEGRLLPELYSRLSLNIINVPSLDSRPDDVAIYANHAIAQLNTLFNCEKSLSEKFVSFLSRQPWEGNLVELKNRLLISYRGTEDGEEIVYDSRRWPSLIHQIPSHVTTDTAVTRAIGMTLTDAENQLIKATLNSVNNNKSQAARKLGISLKTLYNRLKS